MPQLCDLQIHVNGQQTFLLNEKIMLTYSGRLKKIMKQENRRSRIKNWAGIEIDDFPGGPEGFELASRFCYNNGRITITVSNVCVLHCCAIFLGMNEEDSACNLLQQTETFLEGMFYWSWNDILICLKSCEPFFTFADSSGLVQKLLYSLLAKISQNSDPLKPIIASPSSSSSSSSESTTGKEVWWFEGLSILAPNIIEKVMKTLGAYGKDNNSLILTKFLLHYLKTAVQTRCDMYGGLADTAVYGVILVGKSAFSCRGLFWVLRVVSGIGVRRDCRGELERLIGGVLDRATLDDLLVSAHAHGYGQDDGVYDVNLVLRLIRVFVNEENVGVDKMKKVGRLIDKYLREISPDHNLKMSKFLQVAESLPHSARDCFDEVYRAIDIYLECHGSLSWEERSRLCRCLNYEKLSLEACKELAKNPRIPPRIAVQALVSQQFYSTPLHILMYTNGVHDDEHMRLNLHRMQWRVLQLEKVCRDMKTHMSGLVKNLSSSFVKH